MGQKEVLEWLATNYPKRYTAAQIIYFLQKKGISGSVIYANIRKLRESKQISYIWGLDLSSKGRPARYYFKKEDKDG